MPRGDLRLVDEPVPLPEALSPRYRIEEEIGRGGMAVVYRAFDLKIPRQVAVKVLHREFAAFILRDRFLQEIRTIARLTHPNILPLYDADEIGGWLFYVMPLVEGGTLHDRLAREGRLPAAEVLDLARQIGAALAFAHGRSPHIIHRDIKPANILLSGSHAFLTDFGIAQVTPTLQDDGVNRLTDPGLRVGTPGYMSPEQQHGEPNLDARSDQYSLAVVLYELLTGFIPPLGHDHTTDAFARLTHECPAAHPEVVAALRRALTIDRGGRYPSVADFLGALEARPAAPGAALLPSPVPTPVTDHTPVTPGKRPRLIFWVAALGLLGSLAGLLVARAPATLQRLFSRPAAPDTTRYAVLPFIYDSGLTTLNERPALRDALAARWTGLALTEEFREAEMVKAHTSRAWSTADALLTAQALGAGRYIMGTVTRMGDSIRILAGLYDATRGGTQLSFATERLPAGAKEVSHTFARIADLLVLRNALPPDSATDRLGSRSLPAVQAFAAGARAIADWALPAADSAFDNAITFDRDFTRAYLWLGLTRQWERQPSGRWRTAAELAATSRSRLDRHEQRLADALLASARNDADGACIRWDSLTAAEPADFVAWYGSGFCQVTDSVVVPASQGPMRWHFRSSYYSGLRSLTKAFRLNSRILSAQWETSAAALRNLFYVEGNYYRDGTSADGTQWFTAFPTLSGDTLAFEPTLTAGALIPNGGSRRDRRAVVLQQRRLLLELTEAWTATAPDDPSALEAKGIALDLLGRRDAIETLRQAMRLARRPGERARVGQSLTWLLLKQSLPDDTNGVGQALSLIDSLLTEQSPATATDPVRLAGLAALTGRVQLAVLYLRQPQALVEQGVPPELGGLATSLLIYSAIGGPTDTLDRLARQVTEAIAHLPDPAPRNTIRASWLGRAATLAYPVHPLPGSSELAGLGDPLLDAQLADLRGDSLERVRWLRQLAQLRSGIPPYEFTLDGLYPEAALRARAGDPGGAAAWIDSTLSTLPEVSADVLADPIRAAVLVPTIVLRADLAHQADDQPAAGRWARAAGRLWRSADPFLKPTLERMRSLAR